MAVLICYGVLMDRDRWRHSYLIVRGEVLGFIKDTIAKALANDVFIDQERKLGDRRRPDTVLALTINHADYRLEIVNYTTPSTPYEKAKSSGSEVCMVARLKLNITASILCQWLVSFSFLL